MDRFIEFLKRLWANPIIKTVIVTAAGGALGAVEPMIAAGSLVLNASTINMAAVGAVSAVSALYIQHPTNPAPKV